MKSNYLSLADEITLAKIVENISLNNAYQKSITLIRIHKITLMGAAGILMKEVLMGGQVSEFIRLSQYDRKMSFIIAATMLFLLILFIIASYLIFKVHAQSEDLSTEAYLQRFKIVKWGGLLSELIVMFLFLFAVMYLRHGVWVAPLLTLYVGNFLLQGHLFRLQTRYSTLLAFLCYLFSALSLYFSYHQLWVPLTIFIGINILSLQSIKRSVHG